MKSPNSYSFQSSGRIMWQWLLLFIAVIVLAAVTGCGGKDKSNGTRYISRAELPAEAHHTLDLIQRGGPFPYQRDGSSFGNFERRLPSKERGYYREFTVATPGSRDRGARRIVAGRGREYYYTSDHYRTFRQIRD